jgi:hypothetical protein
MTMPISLLKVCQFSFLNDIILVNFKTNKTPITKPKLKTIKPYLTMIKCSMKNIIQFIVFGVEKLYFFCMGNFSVVFWPFAKVFQNFLK